MNATLSASSGAGRWWPAGALIIVGLFVYPLFLPIPVVDPDEGLHGAIAQEMVERGDWITPRFLGEPFFDKPILYFWAEAASLRLFGFHAWALRLPGLLLGLLGVAVTGWGAAKLFSRPMGILAALCYATMILPTALSQAASHDVALVPWVVLAVVLFWDLQREHRPLRQQAFYVVVIGLCLGLSCLAKGLVGVGIIGTAFGLYLLVSRRLSWSICLAGAAALAIGALVALPWYLAMEARNPGYLHYFIVDRHLRGYATASQVHSGRPMWYYLPILLGGGMPWALYLPSLVRELIVRRRQGWRVDDRGACLLLGCWFVGGAVLLSVARSKLVTYIWPIMPPLAILSALPWAWLLEGRLAPASRKMLASAFRYSCLAGPLLLPVVVVVASAYLKLSLGVGVWVAIVVVSLAAWAPLYPWSRQRVQPALATGMVSMALQIAMVLTTVLPAAARQTTARDLAAYFNATGRVPAEVVVLDERIGSLVFYLDPALRRTLVPDQVSGVASNRAGERLAVGSTALVALAEDKVRRAERSFRLDGLGYERAGRYRLYTAGALLSFARPIDRGRPSEARISVPRR